MKNRTSYCAAIFSLLLWGTTFALAKMVTPDPLNPFTFIALRSFFGLIVLFSFLILAKQVGEWFRVFKRHIKSFLLIGTLFFAVAYLLQFWALSMTTASNQSIISNTQAFWVVIFNILFFKQKPSKRFIMGLMLAMSGVLLIIMNTDINISGNTIIGDLLSLLSFIFWGGYTAFIKPITTEEKPIYVTTSIIFVGALIIIPASLFYGAPAEMAQLSLSQWGIVSFLGIFCVGVTYLLWNYALSNKEIRSENIAILTALNPVIGIITSVLWLGEVFSLRMFIGFVLIVIALFVSEYNPKKEIKKGNEI
ncbi:hypothetical protein NEF87_001987 [Candidatus Lokiarchaeum ossiferum]|uniref:EamA domain-containing protein n=1 Tax=Candidatus Lokiarchaeum ossiferum TaxID=2951803 RepID=A0ABY6HS51_9ARCH|nr:hypothetical protein NEF87_001987 [Candidatus Lokiarchaeum sp. B-35]